MDSLFPLHLKCFCGNIRKKNRCALFLFEDSRQNRKGDGECSDYGEYCPFGRALNNRHSFGEQRCQKSKTNNQYANNAENCECNCNSTEIFHLEYSFLFSFRVWFWVWFRNCLLIWLFDTSRFKVYLKEKYDHFAVKRRFHLEYKTQNGLTRRWASRAWGEWQFRES